MMKYLANEHTSIDYCTKMPTNEQSRNRQQMSNCQWVCRTITINIIKSFGEVYKTCKYVDAIAPVVINSVSNTNVQSDVECPFLFTVTHKKCR